jgi:tripartite-type tricarboxylate transporter receptor subunit TctC
MLVGFPPGQSSDVVARIFAAEMAKALGQAVVVENKPGAGSTLAVEAAVHATPDGYTLLFGSSSSLVVAPSLYTVRYDSVKDLIPISMLGGGPLVLVVRADSPYKTLQELIQAGKSSPGALTYGSGGNGAMTHLTMELLMNNAGVKYLHVPYKGSGPAMVDLLGGQIHSMFDSTTVTLALIKEGKLRPLAVSSTQRLSELPNVPAVREFYDGFEAITWGALCAPAGTPMPIVEKLNAVLNPITKDPAIKAKMKTFGLETFTDSTPATARASIVAELAKWNKLVKSANIKVE